jgi:plasmid maintenance system killer protein
LTRKIFYIFCFSTGFLFAWKPASAQFKVRGTVYDSSRIYPLESVTVLSTGGKGAFTDSNGHYEIQVGEKDSIWFSYLGKPTIKYPVLKMNDPLHFDIAIQRSVGVLKEVKIFPRNYKQDSIQNRIDYAKAFDYQRPGLKPNVRSDGGSVGVGFDLDEIIRIFQFRRNKMMLKFQERLVEQEQDKFIDHRFNKQLVRRLTNLTDAKLDNFMIVYRPSYQFTLMSSDYDFQTYIKKCYQIFSRQNSP